MRYLQARCCPFEETGRLVSSPFKLKLKTTGCPIRADIRTLPSREAAAGRLGLNPSYRTLLVTGASLGAQTVNEAVIEMLKGMTLQGWQVLHLSGREHADAVR